MVRSQDTDILEFEEKGFTDSNSNTLKKLRNRNINFKKFDSSVFNCVGRNPKYSDKYVFGKRLVFYYNVEKEKELIKFLLQKFFDNHPVPNGTLRSAFTRILHQHNLCWYGCHHCGKDREYEKKQIE